MDEVISCSTLASIDALARQMVDARQVPGLSVAIVRGTRIAFERGYGHANLETRSPAAAETVYPIYSATKTFTAGAVMRLAESGRLSLDDPLSRFFPKFPRAREVTVRQLLDHTSGIRDYAAPDFPYNASGITSEALVDYIARQPRLFDFAPGTAWKYSNSNYALLGRIIEQVSGLPYGRYMAEQVFPLANLQRTAMDRNAEVVEGRAQGYMPDPASVSGFRNGIYVDMSVPFAAGGLRSTAGDLARWFAALFEGKIVNQASLAQMTTAAKVRDGRLAGDAVHEGKPGSFGYYGLGLEIRTVAGHKAVGHGGTFPSFNSIVRSYPDDGFMIVVLANSGAAASIMESRAARLILRGLPAKGQARS
jgi:CubicO group peptidase (beta-lactamase class C family)